MKKIIAILVVIGFVACLYFTGCSQGDKGYAHDVVFLSSKHYVIAKWDGGVAVTHDGGASWRDKNTIPFNKLTVGLNGQLWGYHAWRGIHEPSSATLAYSTNGGDSWTSIELDADLVMPATFMNVHGECPLLLTRTGQIWRLVGKDLKAWRSWNKYGIANPDSEGAAGLAVGKYLYVSSANRIWLSGDGGKTWNKAELPEIVCFAQDVTDLWAIDRKGNLYKTRSGENQWNLIAQMPAVEIPFGLAATQGKVYVAAEGEGWVAYGQRWALRAKSKYYLDSTENKPTLLGSTHPELYGALPMGCIGKLMVNG